MRCPDFDLRLDDEDCRAALTEGGGVPPDVAAHLATCHACREQWDEAELVTRGLRAGLLRPLPGRLRSSLHAIPRRERTRSWVAGARHASRALAAGALAAAVVAAATPAAVPWQLAVFGTVLSAALVVLHGRRANVGGQIRRLLRQAGSMPAGFARVRSLPAHRGQ